MPGPVDSGIVFAFEVFKKNSEMQKRIVVLGGVGFIGSHLCRRLLDAGHEVFCIDVRDITNAPVLRGLLKQPSLRYIHHNIIHPFGIRCDEIYNLAAPTMVRYSKALPVETLKVSMLGSIHALDTARSEHARVVLGSTGHVYGLHKRCGENLSTQRIIAEGKRAAEALHRAYRADYGLDTRIARIFNTYGSGADLLDQRVVVKMIVAALQGHEIVVEGSGEQTRTFCWIDDLVDGLVRLRRLRPASGSGQSIWAATTRFRSWRWPKRSSRSAAAARASSTPSRVRTSSGAARPTSPPPAANWAGARRRPSPTD